MHIMIDDSNFNLELKINGTNIFVKTHTPIDVELRECPKVTLSSPHEWNPHTTKFHNNACTF